MRHKMNNILNNRMWIVCSFIAMLALHVLSVVTPDLVAVAVASLAFGCVLWTVLLYVTSLLAEHIEDGKIKSYLFFSPKNRITTHDIFPILKTKWVNGVPVASLPEPANDEEVSDEPARENKSA